MNYGYIAESPCNPCPKYCRRPAYPRIGWLGALGYVVEAVTVIWVGFMLIGVASRDYRIVLGLLLGTILFDFLFWAINLFTGAPCYSIQTLPSACNPCGCELIVRGDPCDFHTRVVRDFHHGNDQQHLSSSIMAGLYVLFFFGWFVGQNGGQTFGSLPLVATSLQIMQFVIAQSILLAIIGAFGYGFKLLMDSHSDIIIRLVTALPEPSPKKGEELSYAQRQKLSGNRNTLDRFNDF